MKPIISVIILLFGLACAPPANADEVTVAAASTLRFAMDEIETLFEADHPDTTITVVYGSSGKMTTQIMNGAPYDIFFSADIAYPERLHDAGTVAHEPITYAVGRIVLWSKRWDATNLRLNDLTNDTIQRVAIAQPSHAPYGARAKEALIAAGVWEAVQPKCVYGENIAQTAQMVESEAADVGIIALSLALFPRMTEHGYRLIDESLHAPLIQGYVLTKRGAANESARRFAAFMQNDAARAIMIQYGFVLPDVEPHHHPAVTP